MSSSLASRSPVEPAGGAASGPGAPMVAVTAVFAAVATSLGAAFWWPVYEHPRFILLVAVVVSLGVLLGAVAVLRRWSGWVLLAAAAGLFLLVGVPLAVPSRAVSGVLPTPEGLLDLVAGAALTWKQLLTITIPVGDYQALLVPVLVLVLSSAVAGVRFGVLERGGGAAVAGPVLLAGGGILFGGPASAAAVLLALGLLAVCLAWLVARRLVRRRAALRALGAADRGTGTGRSLAAGAGILVLACAAGIAATSAAPPVAERQLLREEVEQPFDPRDEPSPLAGFRAYLREENAGAVQLRVAGLEPGDRLRIAALDRYDGVVYGVGGSLGEDSAVFVRVPTAVSYQGAAGVRRELAVEVAGYEGVWLPAVGFVEKAEFGGPDAAVLADGFVLNLASGVAAVTPRLSDGDVYRVVGLVPPAVPLDRLAEATPGEGELPRVEVVPDGLASLLDSWVAGIAKPGGRLVEAMTQLRSTGYVSHGLGPDEPPSRSGHGADRIADLLTEPLMVGDAEQYAVAAALMARQLGFPARVVVGFAPEEAGRLGTVEVRGSDITAWIEVDTAEYGWVAVDPVPEPREIPEEDPEELVRIARPESAVPPPPERIDDRDEQTTPESDREEPEESDPVLAAFLAVARIAGAVLIVAAILAAPLLLVVAAKLQRRRRRRLALDPFERVRGGWDDFADTVVDHGLADPPAASTRSEFAADVGTAPARVLAAVVDRATFAPERVDPQQADQLWDAVDELRSTLEAAESPWRRLRATVSLRSFRRYRSLRLVGERGRR